MKKIIQLTVLLTIAFSLKSFAQVDSVLENREYRNGYISFASIKPDKSTAIDASKESFIKEVAGNQSGLSFQKIVSAIVLKSDKTMQQEKYLLYKNGIRLRGGEYTIATINNKASFIHGFFAPISQENFEKTYSIQICMRLAIEQFNQSHQVKNAIDPSFGIADTAFAVYYYDYVQEQYRPAFQIKVTSKNGAYSENIFISAATGRFLGAENLICTINFPGTAQTRYSGTRNIVSDAPTAAGPFRLQETRGANNVLIRTRNMNHQTNLSNVTEFTDNNNAWTVAEHGTNQAAFDAHWGAETVHDYWLNVHNRNSINGSGMAIESYVHLGTNVFNARWVSGLNVIQYGDGVGGTNPLTSLDICAHEFGHGIDQFTGDLLYERESGALDEGFADIWGACIEAWAKPGGNRWLLGEEVLGGPIRNMSNPNAFGQPDTYLGINWVNQVGCTPSFDPISGNDGCGVHTNSGVLNFWFFLLSDGGIGTNDIGNPYNVAGIGIEAAADIAYATKQLVGGMTNYATCRSLSIQAATTLFGANSCEVKAVTDAWYAVGVGAAYLGNLGMSITGDDFFCTTTSNNYTIPGLPMGAVVSWSAVASSGNVTINSPSSSQTTLTRISNGKLTLKATISNLCGSNIILQKDISTGVPELGTLSFSNSVNENMVWCSSHTGNKFSYEHYYLSDVTNYETRLLNYPSMTVYGTNNAAHPDVPDPHGYVPDGWYIFEVRATNACGTSNWLSNEIEVVNCFYYSFRINASPNPSKNIVQIRITDENSEVQKLSSRSNVIIELYRMGTGVKIKQWSFKNDQTAYNLSLGGVGKGLYLVTVTKGNHRQSTQLIVE